MVVLQCYLESFQKAGYNIMHVITLQNDHRGRDLLDEYTSWCSKHSIQLKCFTIDRFYKKARSFSPVKAANISEEQVATMQKFSPDIIFCFDITSAGLMNSVHISGKNLVWLGDLNFQTVWYSGLYAVKENIRYLIQLPIARLKRWRWKQYYRDVLKKVDSVIVGVHSSERELKTLGIDSVYHSYPWPKMERTENVIVKPEKPSFVFLGNLVGLGSRSGLHLLLDRTYPALKNQWGQNGFIISICGTEKLPPWVDDKICDIPEIKFLGFVDDLSQLLLSSHGVIVPIDVPVGHRSRIITAMSLGVPVVAHSNTALGNPSLIHKKTCLLADNANSFASCMLDVFNSSEVSETLTRNSVQEYEREYQPDKAGGRMIQEFTRILK